MSDQKYTDRDNYSIESLDSNMKQIESTNNIINNLENQLSSFFSKSQNQYGNNEHVGYSNIDLNDHDNFQTSQQSSNLDYSNKKMDDSQQNNTNTLGMHNNLKGGYNNFFDESNPNSEKKIMNYHSENIQMNKRNQDLEFQNKFSSYQHKIGLNSEENNLGEEQENQFDTDRQYSNQIEQIKEKYRLNLKNQDEGIEKCQLQQQEESLQKYQSLHKNSQMNSNPTESTTNIQDYPLFQNKNLMQHLQTAKYEGNDQKWQRQNNFTGKNDKQKELDDLEEQLRQELSKGRDPLIERRTENIHGRFDNNQQRGDLSQGRQEMNQGGLDMSQGRESKNMLDNSMMSVKNKDELENELQQLQKRLTQFDQESLTRRNLNQTQQTINQSTQQPITNGQIPRPNNQVNETLPTQQKLGSISTITNREVSSIGYQSSSRINQTTQSSQNTCSVLPTSTSSRGNESIVQKLQKMEEFYQNRTRILEERINVLENENSKLLRINTELVGQNEQLQQKLMIQKEQYNVDIQKTLREQESRLNSEFSINLNKFSSKNQEFLSQQLEEKHIYSRELDTMKEEREKLAKELEDMKKNQIELIDERDNINQSYSNLLTVHNQMLQIDIQKNERSLHHSVCLSSYSERNSKPAILPNQQIFQANNQINNQKQDQQRYQQNQINVNNSNQQQLYEGNQIFTNSNSVSNQNLKLEENQVKNLQQPEWREELGKLKEELEIERRQRDKLQTELRDQSNVEEKHLQADSQEINALYQKIFMNKEIKPRELEKKEDDNYQKNLKQRKLEDEDEEEGQQHYNEDHGFAPRFSHKDNKENGGNKHVQFEEKQMGRRESIFKNESISNNIPKSNSSNLNLKKSDINAYGESHSSRITYSQYNQKPQEIKKISNQAGNQLKKPPKTGGLTSTPQSKKQLKDNISRDNSQKRYSTVSSQQIVTSSSQENYNNQNFHSADSQRNSKSTENQITDKKFVQKFVKEVDKLKKMLEQKKKKILNTSGNQTSNRVNKIQNESNLNLNAINQTSNGLNHQSEKNNKFTSACYEQPDTTMKKSSKSSQQSGKKLVGNVSTDNVKKSLSRSISANHKKD